MALFYLIRHGEPDYEAVSKIGFYGFGRSFAPLSEKGIQQALETANDPRLVDADLIICSFRVLKYIENIAPGEIIACKYEKGQAECEYAFSNQIRFQ